ncbi:MAG: replication/maintenance protein RepL [Pseudomonadota bacterium]|nr:replication/maintenance protein RepL [Pseudomonadota bacterium]
MGQTESGDWFDHETGEVMEYGVAVIVTPKKKMGFREGWVAMSQGAMEVFKDIRSADQQRVLWALLEVLDFENHIQVSQTKICKDLNMAPANVSRSIKALHERGVLIKGPKVGRSLTYRLNPDMGWKGSAKQHNQALQDRMKQANMRVVTSGTEAPAELERQALEEAGQTNWLDHDQ